jgi:hypothetical protein
MATIDTTNVRYYGGLTGSTGVSGAQLTAFITNAGAEVAAMLGKTAAIDSGACTDFEKPLVEKWAAADALMTLQDGMNPNFVERARNLRYQVQGVINDMPAEWTHEMLDVTT